MSLKCDKKYVDFVAWRSPGRISLPEVVTGTIAISSYTTVWHDDPAVDKASGC